MTERTSLRASEQKIRAFLHRGFAKHEAVGRCTTENLTILYLNIGPPNAEFGPIIGHSIKKITQACRRDTLLLRFNFDIDPSRKCQDF